MLRRAMNKYDSIYAVLYSLVLDIWERFALTKITKCIFVGGRILSVANKYLFYLIDCNGSVKDKY